MPQSATDAFKATPECPGDFFTRTGDYFYVPAFQRPFSWKASEGVERLFLDVAEGIEDILTQDTQDSLIFIGALILVEDKRREQILPIVRDQVPARVYIVIDGQQRCTTLLIWACALLDQIAGYKRKLKKFASSDAISRLIEEANKSVRKLELMVHDDERGNDESYTFYPRMIRAHDDVWSKRSAEAKYCSPIARFLRAASDWIREGSKTTFDYSTREVVGSEKSSHEEVVKAWRFLKKRCVGYAAGERFEGVDPPDVKQIAKSAKIQEALWGNPWSEIAAELVASEGDMDPKSYRYLQGLIRLTALANFMLNNVCFTAVRSDREKWAFDVFDALNTTGQPLTAFETFRPQVISGLDTSTYRDSQEYRFLERIGRFLGGEADKKSTRTEKFVIHARLLGDGGKISKRLAVQRQWLKKFHNELGVPDEKRSFLASLAELAEFSELFARQAKADSNSYEPWIFDKATRLALRHLSQVNHDIVVPVLSRFYAATKVDNEEKRRAARAEFDSVVRATAAFSTLWRLAHGGTSKIDDCYRGLMRGPQASQADSPSCGPYCLWPSKLVEAAARPLTYAAYVEDLKYWLRHAELDCEDHWVKKAADRSAYTENMHSVKLFIAAAMHDAVPDADNPPLLKKGTKGTCPMLQSDSPWVENYQVEHVAPQNGESQGWDPKLYDNGSLVHSIGNLTLLQPSVNAAIKNWNWDRKRAVLSLLVSESADDIRKRRESLIEGGTLPDFPTLDEILEKATFHAYLRPICQVETWTPDVIRQRSLNLCKLGYQRMMQWMQ